MYGSMQPLSIWRSYMVNAVAGLPAVDFVRPSGLEIPPEPKIIDDKDKDKDKEKDKEKDKKDSKQDKAEPAAKKAAEEAIGTSTETPKKPSMRDRVREILEGNSSNNNTKPVVSNQPTPAK